MMIALVRHFEADLPNAQTFRLLSPQQFAAFVRAYDDAFIAPGQDTPALGSFEACYASDLPRALATAHILHNGPVIQRAALRELPIAPFTSQPVRLPLCLWLVLGRLAWLLGHRSQQPGKHEYRARLRALVDAILAAGHESVLIVSHGITLYFLGRELQRRGYVGSGRAVPAKGEIRLFESRREP